MTRNLAVLLSLFILTSYAFAQDGRCKEKCQQEIMHEKKSMMKLHTIDLSDEQRNELENSKYELEKNTIKLKADIQLKNLDFQREMQSENLNRNKLMKLTEDISKLELKIKLLKLEHKLKIHNMLTPEQRMQLKQQEPEIMIKKKILKKNCSGNCQD